MLRLTPPIDEYDDEAFIRAAAAVMSQAVETAWNNRDSLQDTFVGVPIPRLLMQAPVGTHRVLEAVQEQLPPGFTLDPTMWDRWTLSYRTPSVRDGMAPASLEQIMEVLQGELQPLYMKATPSKDGFMWLRVMSAKFEAVADTAEGPYNLVDAMLAKQKLRVPEKGILLELKFPGGFLDDEDERLWIESCS